MRLAAGDNPPCVITRATTYDNRAALASPFYSRIISKYEGTRIGRQELLGEVIEEMEGALWNRAIIDAARDGRRCDPVRTVVAIDPAVSSNATSNLTGIVVAAVGHDGRQELLGEVIEESEGALWTRDMVEAAHDEKRSAYARVVVAVDPAVTSNASLH